MERFALLYGQARSAVLVYSMGLTQHEFGVENVKAIVNLALSRGMIGREKCGIMPIRGHSGVQGGGECGAEPDKFPGGFPVNDESARRFSNLWRHPVPSKPGLRVPEMIEAASDGELNFLYSIGGNLLETMPDRNFICQALERVRSTGTSGYRSQQLHASRCGADGYLTARPDPLRTARRRNVHQHGKTNPLHA